jgi:hypothetical protein
MAPHPNYSRVPHPYISNGKPALFNGGKVDISNVGALLSDGDGGIGKEASISQMQTYLV